MLKKLLLVVSGFLLSFNLIGSALASDVFITARGKHYHLAGCSKVQGKRTATLDEMQAKMRGLRPCPICFPDAGANNSEDKAKDKKQHSDDEKQKNN